MDNADIFILNGRNFYLSDKEIYDINLQNIENFLKENINNVPKSISFCDNIYFYCKKTYPDKSKELLLLTSLYIKNTYFSKIIISMIKRIKYYDVEYTYLIKFCELALVNINTEDCAVDAVNISLMSSDIIELYGNHMNNFIVSGFILDNFRLNYDIIKKIEFQIENVMHYERNKFRINHIFTKIINSSVYLNLTTAETCCNLLFLVRNYSDDDDIIDMMVLGKNKHKKIKIMVNKMKDKIFNNKEFLNNETKILDTFCVGTKQYYCELFLKIIEIYENSNDKLLKKCCAYELADYVYSDTIMLNGTIFLQHSDKTKKIIDIEGLYTLYT